MLAPRRGNRALEHTHHRLDNVGEARGMWCEMSEVYRVLVRVLAALDLDEVGLAAHDQPRRGFSPSTDARNLRRWLRCLNPSSTGL
jgi:hypothetical protein